MLLPDIISRARCLLNEFRISRKFWPEVMKAATYIGNRVLANTVEKKTPTELFYGNKPNVHNLVFYGSLSFVRTLDEKRIDKFSKKGMQGKIVGYDDDMDYCVLVDNKTIISRNVRIINKNSSRIVYLEEKSNTENREAHEPDAVKERRQIERREPDRYGTPVVYFSSVDVPRSYVVKL